MTHLDLCTGIGGFHIAAEWAGFTTIGFSEVDPYCCKLLAQKWPGIKNYGDLRTADFDELGRVTVLSAGVPCQPASLAGKRRGEKDDRWLWPAVLDVVERVECDWCVFENPPGILSLDAFAPILLRLEGFGYEVRGFDVPADAVGADTEGYRIFIVATSSSAGCERSSGWPGEIRCRKADESERSSQDSNTVAAPMCAGLETSGVQVGHGTQFTTSGRAVPEHVWLPTDPRVYGSFDGLPNRAHRIKALGNSCCPQQVAPIFASIAQTESELAND